MEKITNINQVNTQISSPLLHFFMEQYWLENT